MSDFTITEEHFPTPTLRRISSERAVGEHERRLAQAKALMTQELMTMLRPLRRYSSEERHLLLEAAHDALRYWRQGLMVSDARPERLRLVNHLHALESLPPLRLGAVSALRHHRQWDASRRAFVGGSRTPASDLAGELGHLIVQRFEQEAPHEAEIQEVFDSHRGCWGLYTAPLLRGDTARRALEAYAQAQADVGRPMSSIDDDGGELLCVMPSGQSNMMFLLSEGFALLSADDCSTKEWAEAVYLLAQARLDLDDDSDIHRVLAFATGTAILRREPKLPSDCALRALVTPRLAFIEELVALQG